MVTLCIGFHIPSSDYVRDEGINCYLLLVNLLAVSRSCYGSAPYHLIPVVVKYSPRGTLSICIDFLALINPLIV